MTPGLLTYVQCSQVQETRGALSLEKYVVNDDDDDDDDDDNDDHHEDDDHHHNQHSPDA